MTKEPESFYTLDLTPAAKLRGLSLSGGAGAFAAVAVGGPVTSVVALLLPLPAFAGLVAGTFAFAAVTAMVADYWNDHMVHPNDLVVRKTVPPKIVI